METPTDETPEIMETSEPAPRTGTDFPIVGIGASAGGLAAFEAFFSGMPADTDPGMAFILVQHLAPDHKSILSELVQRYTRMRVFEVADGMTVEPNCAYIIPPAKDMTYQGGALHLTEPEAPRGQRLPIDAFFRSLAQDQRERAIGVVLSGNGSDGALGVRAIKGEGGMVMVQTPSSTDFDSMPRAALATGLVDFELVPAEMPAKILAYIGHAFSGPQRSLMTAPVEPVDSLRTIFALLLSHTGHDFSQYKPSTVHRRIERRMAIRQIETMESYVEFLKRTPAELEALFRDMLIGVTSFFRDPEAFRYIEERILPKLHAAKAPAGVLRIWSAGCSTGEESYSLAILLSELLQTKKPRLTVQIFATDIDNSAIAVARAGLYPSSIAADITPRRLARFFTLEPDGCTYRIHRSIRDMLVFSEHNVIKDPPFSRLDLICCRNMLIYMGSELQKRVMPLFHYALNPGGVLFLGSSESVGDFGNLFTALDRRLKLYQRREDFVRRGPHLFLPPMTAVGASLPQDYRAAATAPGRPTLRDLTEQVLLQQAAPVAALIHGNGDILYLYGRTGQYLEPAPGETGINNILKMAREGLRTPLAAALRTAATGREVVRCPNLNVKTNGSYSMVNLMVRAVPPTLIEKVPVALPVAAEAPLFMVILEMAATPEGEVTTAVSLAREITDLEASDEAQALIVALRHELRAKEEFLQATNEELETANEELRSSNEEMQSVNEELQSANEELETAKEELQSVNEELQSVNAELQTKVADLTQVNNDMNNLLAGTGIATVFVDHDLRILRFTPTVTRIINLIQTDLGRPVSHIVSNLAGYDSLSEDTQAVLDSLVPRELEVTTRAGDWYTLRILPYRTLENVVEGAVITFVDITAAKRAQEALRVAIMTTAGRPGDESGSKGTPHD